MLVGSAGVGGSLAVDPLLVSSLSEGGFEPRDMLRETILVGGLPTGLLGEPSGERGESGSSTGRMLAGDLGGAQHSANVVSREKR